MSSRVPFLALALLASGLAVVIVLELESARGAREPSAVVAVRHPPKVQPRVASEDPEDHTDAWLADVLARPLFSRDRKPTPPASKAGGSQTLAALPRLTGVVLGPFGRTAIFAGTDGAKAVVVNEGKTVGPYTVQSIRPGGVTVDGPQGEQRVSLGADAATRSALAAEIPRPPQPVMPPGIPGLPPPGGAPINQFNQLQRQNMQGLQNLRPGGAFQRPLPGIPGLQPSREGSN
jgi:hypothetical protein